MDREIQRAKELRNRLENELLLNEVVRGRLETRKPMPSIVAFGNEVRRGNRVPVICLAIGLLFGGALALVGATGLSNPAHAATPPAVALPAPPPAVPACTASPATAIAPVSMAKPTKVAAKKDVKPATVPAPVAAPPAPQPVVEEISEKSEKSEPTDEKLAPAGRTAQLLRDQLAAAIR